MSKLLSLPINHSDSTDEPGPSSNDPEPMLVDTSPATPDEDRMRRALGLMQGRAATQRPQPAATRPDLHAPQHASGAPRRHRFVQDGEVPVVLVKNSRPHDHGGATASGGRLEELEAALAAEQAAHEKAERSLRAANAVIYDLRTNLGHAELARDEAQRIATQRDATEAALTASLAEQAGALEQSRVSLRESEAAVADEIRLRQAAEAALGEARSTAAAALSRARIAEAEIAAGKRTAKPPVAAAVPGRARLAKPPAAKPKAAKAAVVKPRASKTAAPKAGTKIKTSDRANSGGQKPVKWWLRQAEPVKSGRAR